jgi:hypothetical protein
MRALAIAVLLLAPTLANAEPKKDRAPLRTDDCAKARKQHKDCELAFENERVDGQGLKKPGDDIAVPQWAKAGSLIRLRTDFIAEILKSAEDL